MGERRTCHVRSSFGGTRAIYLAYAARLLCESETSDRGGNWQVWTLHFAENLCGFFRRATRPRSEEGTADGGGIPMDSGNFRHQREACVSPSTSRNRP